MGHFASPQACAALFCLALLPLPLHAAVKHPHKVAAAAQRKPAKPIRAHTPPHKHAGPGHARTTAPAHTPSSSVDRATADRVHAFIAAQQQREQRHPQPAQPEKFTPAKIPAQPAASVVEIARRSSNRPQLVPTQAVPVLLPTLYNKRGRLIVPPPLKGSHEILIHQNLVADRDGLTRIQDDADLERMRLEGLLVALPLGSGLQVDERLPVNRRYCRPWTADFLAQLSREYSARFRTPLQVNSAVRTVEFQQRLMHINGNAAPAEGDTASPHLTGQAIDIAKHGLSLTQIAWLRGYLLPLVQEGKIDVEEEFQQACFHISVYKRYEPQPSATRRVLSELHQDHSATLAVSIH